MRRLAHALIAVATGLEQASMVWESLKLQSVQPAQPEPRRAMGFNSEKPKENLAPRECFAHDA